MTLFDYKAIRRAHLTNSLHTRLILRHEWLEPETRRANLIKLKLTKQALAELRLSFYGQSLMAAAS